MRRGPRLAEAVRIWRRRRCRRIGNGGIMARYRCGRLVVETVVEIIAGARSVCHHRDGGARWRLQGNAKVGAVGVGQEHAQVDVGHSVAGADNECPCDRRCTVGGVNDIAGCCVGILINGLCRGHRWHQAQRHKRENRGQCWPDARAERLQCACQRLFPNALMRTCLAATF